MWSLLGGVTSTLAFVCLLLHGVRTSLVGGFTTLAFDLRSVVVIDLADESNMGLLLRGSYASYRL